MFNCSIVSVLSCVAACYVVADCQLCYEIKELLLLLFLLFVEKGVLLDGVLTK